MILHTSILDMNQRQHYVKLAHTVCWPLVGLLFLGLILPANAQTASLAPTQEAKTPPISNGRWGVNLQLSSTGPGLHGSYLLNEKHRLYLRAGLSYFAYNSQVRLKVSNDGDGSYIRITPDLVIGIAQTALRWYPFRRGGFYATGGLGYTWRPDLTFVLLAENTLNFGGLTVTPANVGTIKAGLRWNNVLGYAGFGFGRAVPRRRVGFGAEIGMYYLGKPSVILQYDGFLETTTIDEQIPNVQKNLSGYRYLPMLSFFVSARISNK